MTETMQVVGKIIMKTTKTTVRMLFEGRRANFLEAVVRLLETLTSPPGPRTHIIGKQSSHG